MGDIANPAVSDLGVTFFDSAEVDGPFENEKLVGKALAPVRDQVVIATKFGFRIADEGYGTERMIGVDSWPEHVRAVCEASLKRLGLEVVDLFYQHRDALGCEPHQDIALALVL